VAAGAAAHLRLCPGAENGEVSLVDYLPRYFAGRGLPDLGPLFQRALEQGRYLLLLDGLDEVLEARERSQIAAEVATLMRTLPGNRFLVTSRIAGYSQAGLPGDLALFTIQPFEDQDLERFARQWCLAYETMTGVTPEAERRATERAASLIEAIHSHPAIRRLAANPLLVTILALIHYQGTRLPHRRVELYRLCVEALAETWNLAHSLSGRPIDLYLEGRRLDEQEVVSVLAPIAFWMHHQRPGGLVERAELEGRIAAHYQEREGMSPEKAAGLAHDFVELIREQSGLLVERGLGQFGFMHLTFEEYLTARHVAAQEDPFALLQPHLHDPRWREPLLLTAGILGSFSQPLATRFVQALLEVGSPYQDILHRDLLLAARCLADDVPLALALRRRILDGLFALWRTTRYQKLREEVTGVLAEMQGSAAGPQVVAFLLAALKDEREWVRGQAAEALGQLGQASGQVVAGLLAALQDEDEEVRGRAAWALGLSGQASEQVVAFLLAALQDESEGVRGQAALALGLSGQAPEQVVAFPAGRPAG